MMKCFDHCFPQFGAVIIRWYMLFYCLANSYISAVSTVLHLGLEPCVGQMGLLLLGHFQASFFRLPGYDYEFNHHFE